MYAKQKEKSEQRINTLKYIERISKSQNQALISTEKYAVEGEGI